MIIVGFPVAVRRVPFSHSVVNQILESTFAEQTLQWLEDEAPWRLRVESFYEQYELNLHQVRLPLDLRSLVDSKTINCLKDRMLGSLTQDSMALVEANAHKLISNQTIKIHNDFIEGAETYRILIQLNRGWNDENGGFLVLFSGPNAAEVARIIRPIHRSAVAFEISPASFHAVSTIRSGTRYTLVYSFKSAK
jgi:Rps23 Pro-64 3,4-dihydroxylase Tpa1-like proline 4-hydroxylase